MRVVLTGASGQLGPYLRERLATAGHRVVAWGGRTGGVRDAATPTRVDLTDPAATAEALEAADPEVVLHAAAISTAEGVRQDPERGRAVNVEATARLAAWCARRGRRLVFTSTDLVFDGSTPWNREDSPAEPVLAYGRTKREAEPFVTDAGGLVARLSLLYGPSRSAAASFFDRTFEDLRKRLPQTFFEDEYRTPLDFRTAADALVRLAESGASGVVHVGGRERLSRYDLARRAAAALGFDPALILANRQRDATFPEPRPADVSLDTTRLAALLPGLDRPPVERAVSALWAGA